jgi:hypothetical protein
MRIVDVSSSSFRFEIGLVRAPISSLSKDFRIEIKLKGVSDLSYEFTKERLNYDNITYLTIGERPFEKYKINLKNGNNKLREFWPEEINGINPEGTLFEKALGKKIANDADVEIGKEYYLLKRGYLNVRTKGNIRIQHVAKKYFGWEIWNLYIVSALVRNAEAARFYLDFHCRLTNHPVSLHPVWPLFVKGNYMVKHNQNVMYVLVEGDAPSVKTFPYVMGTVHKLNYNESQSKLYEIHCSSRQQLISAGRTHAVQYTYFWREPLNHIGACPPIFVTDLVGGEISPGESNILPHNKTLRFISTFDGEIIISNNKNKIIEKRKLPADKYIELDSLSYGLSIKIVVGLDAVWQINFKKQQSVDTNNEIEILKQIINAPGNTTIPIPHSLKNILVCMSCYPKISHWIRNTIRNGIINEQSYRRLQEFYRNINENR